MTRGRYAPSPTGFLHLGNARTALVAYWHTKAQNGTFVMRVEDLDSARSKPELVAANLEELRWLGLSWDEGPDVGGPYPPYVQSQRHHLYQAALDKLTVQDQVFKCYLSRKDLREVASAPHGQMPFYGEAERALNERVKDQKILDSKLPSLRFRVDEPTLSFVDELQGEQTVKLGDFVVKRADGEWAYQLAVVVDDSAMNITEVVRGDDLLQSTAAQLLLYEALGKPPPTFLHVPLLMDETGERMAKRKGSLTLTVLKEQGVKPERVVGLLAHTLELTPEPSELSVQEGLELYRQTSLSPFLFSLSPELLEWLIQ